MDMLPRPPAPPPSPLLRPAFTPESWTQKREMKIILTVVAALYLCAMLASMTFGMIFAANGWGLENQPHLPWPVYLLWIPGFLVQFGIVGVALWLLWKPSRKGRLQHPPGLPK